MGERLPQPVGRFGGFMVSLGSWLTVWNDHRAHHDRRADASWSWRAIDRVAAWLYAWGHWGHR